MTHYETFLQRLNPDNRYLVEERVAIKVESGITEENAEKQAVDEYKEELERKGK